MTASVVVFRDLAAAAVEAPAEEHLRQWAAGALGAAGGEAAELTVRIVDEEESARLNSRYRGRAAATNVLSFAADDPLAAERPYLGDLVVCAAVVEREASEQNKQLQAHWAHMIVHGVLHLLGYDHQREAAAERMENLERAILREFGYPDPYA